MVPRRGCSGKPRTDLPRGVMWPSLFSKCNMVKVSVATRKDFSGRASRNDNCASGVPHAATSNATPHRSTWVISAGRCGRRVESSMRLHNLYATPSRTRPARPLRWSADARDDVTVTNSVSPVRESSRGTRAIPASTPMWTPSTVRDVSAISVDNTTRRRPRPLAFNAASCSENGRAPASRNTSTLPATRSFNSVCALLISPIPGRNTKMSPSSVLRAPRTTSVIAFSRRSLRWRGTYRTSIGKVRPSDVMIGASPWSSAST